MLVLVMLVLVMLVLGSIHKYTNVDSLFYSLQVVYLHLSCTVISEEHLDILAVCETWLYEDTPDTISTDIAPQGYHVLGVPCLGRWRGGGLAVIHHDCFNINTVPVSIESTTFEVQLIRLMVGADRFLITSIYHPPRMSIDVFLNEFDDFLAELDGEFWRSSNDNELFELPG